MSTWVPLVSFVLKERANNEGIHVPVGSSCMIVRKQASLKNTVSKVVEAYLTNAQRLKFICAEFLLPSETPEGSLQAYRADYCSESKRYIVSKSNQVVDWVELSTKLDQEQASKEAARKATRQQENAVKKAARRAKYEQEQAIRPAASGTVIAEDSIPADIAPATPEARTHSLDNGATAVDSSLNHSTSYSDNVLPNDAAFLKDVADIEEWLSMDSPSPTPEATTPHLDSSARNLENTLAPSAIRLSDSVENYEASGNIGKYRNAESSLLPNRDPTNLRNNPNSWEEPTTYSVGLPDGQEVLKTIDQDFETESASLPHKDPTHPCNKPNTWNEEVIASTRPAETHLPSVVDNLVKEEEVMEESPDIKGIHSPPVSNSTIISEGENVDVHDNSPTSPLTPYTPEFSRKLHLPDSRTEDDLRPFFSMDPFDEGTGGVDLPETDLSLINEQTIRATAPFEAALDLTASSSQSNYETEAEESTITASVLDPAQSQDVLVLGQIVSNTEPEETRSLSAINNDVKDDEVVQELSGIEGALSSSDGNPTTISGSEEGDLPLKDGMPATPLTPRTPESISPQSGKKLGLEPISPSIPNETAQASTSEPGFPETGLPQSDEKATNATYQCEAPSDLTRPTSQLNKLADVDISTIEKKAPDPTDSDDKLVLGNPALADVPVEAVSAKTLKNESAIISDEAQNMDDDLLRVSDSQDSVEVTSLGMESLRLAEKTCAEIVLIGGMIDPTNAQKWLVSACKGIFNRMPALSECLLYCAVAIYMSAKLMRDLAGVMKKNRASIERIMTCFWSSPWVLLLILATGSERIMLGIMVMVGFVLAV